MAMDIEEIKGEKISFIFSWFQTDSCIDIYIWMTKVICLRKVNYKPWFRIKSLVKSWKL